MMKPKNIKPGAYVVQKNKSYAPDLSGRIVKVSLVHMMHSDDGTIHPGDFMGTVVRGKPDNLPNNFFASRCFRKPQLRDAQPGDVIALPHIKTQYAIRSRDGRNVYGVPVGGDHLKWRVIGYVGEDDKYPIQFVSLAGEDDGEKDRNDTADALVYAMTEPDKPSDHPPEIRGCEEVSLPTPNTSWNMSGDLKERQARLAALRDLFPVGSVMEHPSDDRGFTEVGIKRNALLDELQFKTPVSSSLHIDPSPRKKIEILTKALERLSKPSAFYMPKATTTEERARMFFAELVLKGMDIDEAEKKALNKALGK